jgi:aminoglycoside phosphotransferase family enzyme/predicted kinase
MKMENQSATIDFLKRAGTYGGEGIVTCVETHVSVIFLTGDQAFKLKRAVRYAYVDFSTAALRLAACRRELELNKRTAPMLYKAVRRVTREADGSLAFDGTGEVVDAVVEMIRFDETTLLDQLAARSALTSSVMIRLAHTVAVFHRGAPIARHVDGAAGMARILNVNERAFKATTNLEPDDVAMLNNLFRHKLRLGAALLDARAKAGKIRRCHGDLHLRNICLIDGMPVLFDCLEFSEALATIDVLYDIAFLIMDLQHRGQAQWGNLLFNRYLDEQDEVDGLPLMPFFLALRAAIRCHVTATQAQDAAKEHRDDLLAQARAYGLLALSLMKDNPPRLIAIGGLSGVGKSTLAGALADRIGPPPGARVLSSDRIRKHLYGVSAETVLPDDAYRAEVSERVYAAMAQQAGSVLACGHAVIVDAAFERLPDRKRVEQIATRAGVAFAGFWLDAPVALRLARVDERKLDASDATASVLKMQMRRGHGAVDWTVVDASGGLNATAESVIRMIDCGAPA